MKVAACCGQRSCSMWPSALKLTSLVLHVPLQPPKKLVGVGIAMAGIVWYTQLKLRQSAPVASAVGQGAANESIHILATLYISCILCPHVSAQGPVSKRRQVNPLLGDIEAVAGHPKALDHEGWVMLKGSGRRVVRS
eukprot:1155503-Pelagomonas_calceolata.AAC.3